MPVNIGDVSWESTSLSLSARLVLLRSVECVADFVTVGPVAAALTPKSLCIGKGSWGI